MFKFTWEWITSLAKEALIERGIPADEAESMMTEGDTWLGALQRESARKEFMNYIETEKDMISWTENNFISSPSTEAAIEHHQAVIADMTDYVNDYLGGAGD